MNNQAISDREFTLHDHEFRFLAELVGKRTGIVLGDQKRNMVYGRLVRRLRDLGLSEFKNYCELLQSSRGSDEMENFINSITTNLTHFFRESHHFEHLEESVFAPLLQQSSAPKRLRIWSAGCSSGAEPYSIAMMLEQMEMAKKGWDCKILATDIDSKMLETCCAGNYPEAMAERIPAPYQRYITMAEDGQSMQVMPALQRYITFNHLNLMEKWPMKGPFDAIFCRNVLIYFDRDTQYALFQRFADLLRPGGWLYIGHSENLGQAGELFEMCGRTTYRKLGGENI